MNWPVLALGGVASVCAGLDRTALLQVMISRPLVIAPLLGWALGIPAVGLMIGALLELLWLARMPVGAAIPPDDTQVAVGATCLVALLDPGGTFAAEPVALFAILVAMPLGKAGQLLDRLARHRNTRLQKAAEQALAEGREECVERLHLLGLVHFGLASLGTFAVILAGGLLLGTLLLQPVMPLLQPAGPGLKLLFPLVGAAGILASLHVSRALTLFCTSFVTVLLTVWLL